MLLISRNVSIPDSEIELQFVRAQGAGGQNVNKVATAVHLRFDIRASSLPEFYKQRLMKLRDSRITKDGVIIIKAQRYRTQDRNRQDALLRLQQLIQNVSVTPGKRYTTRVPNHVKRERLAEKRKRGTTKSLRGKIGSEDY